MGIFATRPRHPMVGAGTGAELSDELRLALPPRFEAVGEALVPALDPAGSIVDACAVVGRDLAQDGVSLAETLDGLRTTFRLVCGGDPGYAALQAISVAWAEAVLGYLHQLSCEDPLTGLASLAHVRSRVSELYRGQLRDHLVVRERHALVVVAVPVQGSARGSGSALLVESLEAGRVGAIARTVFSGAETIGHLAPGRVVALVARDALLARRTTLLRRLLDGPVRVWIEGLPDSDAAAAQLLDELTRS